MIDAKQIPPAISINAGDICLGSSCMEPLCVGSVQYVPLYPSFLIMTCVSSIILILIPVATHHEIADRKSFLKSMFHYLLFVMSFQYFILLTLM